MKTERADQRDQDNLDYQLELLEKDIEEGKFENLELPRMGTREMSRKRIEDFLMNERQNPTNEDKEFETKGDVLSDRPLVTDDP